MNVLNHCEYLIEVIDNAILDKEFQRRQISTLDMDMIQKNIKLGQIQSEINELKNQRQYYSYFIADTLMNNCCGGCCKNKF